MSEVQYSQPARRSPKSLVIVIVRWTVCREKRFSLEAFLEKNLTHTRVCRGCKKNVSL